MVGAIGIVGLTADGAVDPVHFATAGERPGGHSAVLGLHARIADAHGLDLGRGQALGTAIASLAAQGRRVPFAGHRIVYDAVFQPICRVTVGQHRLVDDPNLLGGQGRSRVLVKRLDAEQGTGLDPQIIDRCPGDHAVIIIRIALNLCQALAAPG